MSDFRIEHRLDLGDFALVLAIARAGSLTGAAKCLGMSHPTVFRKARALEERFGTQLFYRDRAGITLTAAGAAIRDVAETLDREAQDLERHFVDQDIAAEGELRVATVDTLLRSPLIGVLRAFRDAMPAIEIDMLIDVAMADIAQREVDVAIRAGGTPPEDLVGRKLCGIAVAIYRPSLSEPISLQDAAQADWVVPDEQLSHLASARWLRAQGHYTRAALKADSLLAVCEGVAGGFGLGILPCYLADPDPRLRRVSPPMEELASTLWFLTRPELRKVAKVRALSEFLHKEFRGVKDLFEGLCPQEEPQ